MCRTRFIWLMMIVLFLAACGGGGSGGDDGSGNPGSGNNNTAPVANAGAQQNVKAGALVRLDGSASRDANGDKLAYDWRFESKPQGSSAKLADRNSATPQFKADTAGTYVAKLVVNDGTAHSEPATVKVVATTAKTNAAPIANAGPMQKVKTGEVVRLDGGGSRDADGDPLTYQWRFKSKPSDSNAKLQNADSATPRFKADAAGSYVARLVVNDGNEDSEPETVTIVATAAKANSEPVADAGSDRGVSVSDTVPLDGSGSSDADGDSLDYSWRLVSVPQGSGATLKKTTTAKPTFVADAAGPYVAELTVIDSRGGSADDRVVITAGPTLKLKADLNASGAFGKAALPYDETSDQTVILESDNGAVLGRFRVTAVGGDITLNTSFDVDVSSGGVALAFDGFQGQNTETQVRVPEGEAIEFTLNAGVKEDTKATVSYVFDVVETGDRFKATYPVESGDYQN